MADLIFPSKSYRKLLARMKSQIQTAQVRAAVAVNRELVLLWSTTCSTTRMTSRLSA